MERIYKQEIKKYLDRKIILISGPRQVGKTTLSKTISEDFEYLNFDLDLHRKVILEKSWDRKKNLLILDEIHKFFKWKAWLKGIYDVEGLTPKILVTGSAKLDAFRKMGDSLAGRFFHYRIHPLDVREILTFEKNANPKEVVERLLKFGGFPESYIEASEEFSSLWRKSHQDIILRQDLLDLETVTNIKKIEVLIELLRERVGSAVSFLSLSRDLQVSDKTIKSWIDILENLYIIFQITPYSKNISKSVLKQKKIYFYDIAQTKNESAKLENLVACSLLKEVHFRNDCKGKDYRLHYLSQKGGKEIDFFVSSSSSENYLIEVKTSEDDPSSSFKIFEKFFKNPKKIQLVQNLKKEKTFPDGTEIRHLGKWLSSW